MRRELMGIIIKNDDGSEVINYDNDEFPSYIFVGYIVKGCTWEKVAHYHEDIEMLTVTHGRMGYNVNGKNILLNEGDTIFVNAGQIHYSFATEDEPNDYVISVIHPRILMSSYSVELDYVEPILTDSRMPYIHFKAGTEFGDRFAAEILKLPDLQGNAFHITRQFFNIWDVILNYCAAQKATVESPAIPTSCVNVKRMLNFVRINYANNVSLADIAREGGVSKTLCNQLFHRFTGMSPVENLIKTRCDRVADLLRSDNLILKEIAEQTGFSSTSYLTEAFKKYYQMTPRDYRKMVHHLNE